MRPMATLFSHICRRVKVNREANISDKILHVYKILQNIIVSIDTINILLVFFLFVFALSFIQYV